MLAATPPPPPRAFGEQPVPCRHRLPPADVEKLFERLSALNPQPKGELEYVNPYTLLVAVVLSAQATDTGVNRATRALFKVATTPAAMLALGEERVRDYVRTIGLYKTKAKNVIALSRLLLDEHGGTVPTDRDALERLPGVGRKTANVVLNIAFGQPTIAVDTHVFRVGNRTGLAAGGTPHAVEDILERRVPERFKPHAHHWLILHGRYICKARKPDCPICPVRDVCRYDNKTIDGAALAPSAPRRPRLVERPQAPATAGRSEQQAPPRPAGSSPSAKRRARRPRGRPTGR